MLGPYRVRYSGELVACHVALEAMRISILFKICPLIQQATGASTQPGGYLRTLSAGCPLQAIRPDDSNDMFDRFDHGFPFIR